MAKHDVNVGVKRTVAGAAFIFSALAVGIIDARFGITDIPLITGIVGGIIGWGIAHSAPGAGGGIVALSGLALALIIFAGPPS
ncbi:MAG: hypothetical protein AAFX04_13145 [Pseudomonadota bacterium]